MCSNARVVYLEMKPKCIRGGKVNDISLELMQLPVDTLYENILLQVGSNDCLDNDFDTDIFQENYIALVKIAKFVCDNVVISGLAPPFDDKIGNIDKGNIVLEQIANDENCLFVKKKR